MIDIMLNYGPAFDITQQGNFGLLKGMAESNQVALFRQAMASIPPQLLHSVESRSSAFTPELLRFVTTVEMVNINVLFYDVKECI